MRQSLTDDVRRFLDGLSHATVSTVDPTNGVHQAVVWFMRDGDEIVVNSAVGRRWPANLVADPRVSIVVADEAGGWVGLRGRVEAITDQDQAQADIAELARRYDPAGLDDRLEIFRTQQRITFRLAPEHIHAEIGEE